MQYNNKPIKRENKFVIVYEVKETSPITMQWLFKPNTVTGIPTANISDAELFESKEIADETLSYIRLTHKLPNAFIFPVTVITELAYVANWEAAYKLLDGVK